MTDKVVNLGTIRSDKSQSAADWAPIDMVRDLLHRMEEGKVDAKAMVIFFQYQEGGVSFNLASPDAVTTQGLIEEGKYKLLRARMPVGE